eukprot:2956246-Pleurochrysis_carterae.AAC.2
MCRSSASDTFRSRWCCRVRLLVAAAGQAEKRIIRLLAQVNDRKQWVFTLSSSTTCSQSLLLLILGAYAGLVYWLSLAQEAF